MYGFWKCKMIIRRDTLVMFDDFDAILSPAAPLPGDPWARAALHQPGWAARWLCGGGASRGGPGHRGEELPAGAAHLEPAATGAPPAASTYSSLLMWKYTETWQFDQSTRMLFAMSAGNNSQYLGLICVCIICTYLYLFADLDYMFHMLEFWQIKLKFALGSDTILMHSDIKMQKKKNHHS